jgi:DnaJ-class molecular chaperone
MSVCFLCAGTGLVPTYSDEPDNQYRECEECGGTGQIGEPVEMPVYAAGEAEPF